MPNQTDAPELNPKPAPASDRWLIEGELTISSIADWHCRFVERTTAAVDLELDLSGVTGADVFGLQLLYSVRRSVIEGGRTFKMISIPAVVRAAATSTGVSLDF